MLILQSFRVTADDPLSGAKISINGKVEAYIIHPANFLKFLLFWIAVGHLHPAMHPNFSFFLYQPEFSRSNLYHQKTTGNFCEHSMKKSNPCLKMSWFTVRLPAFSQLTTIYWKIWISTILSNKIILSIACLVLPPIGFVKKTEKLLNDRISPSKNIDLLQDKIMQFFEIN